MIDKDYKYVETDLEMKSVWQDGAKAVWDLKGSIDSTNYSKFVQAGLALLEKEKIHYLLLRMERLKYVSSAGLGALIELRRFLEKKGGNLWLFMLQTPVKRVLQITKMEVWELPLQVLDAGHPFALYLNPLVPAPDPSLPEKV